MDFWVCINDDGEPIIFSGEHPKPEKINGLWCKSHLICSGEVWVYTFFEDGILDGVSAGECAKKNVECAL